MCEKFDIVWEADIVWEVHDHRILERRWSHCICSTDGADHWSTEGTWGPWNLITWTILLASSVVYLLIAVLVVISAHFIPRDNQFFSLPQYEFIVRTTLWYKYSKKKLCRSCAHKFVIFKKPKNKHFALLDIQPPSLLLNSLV